MIRFRREALSAAAECCAARLQRLIEAGYQPAEVPCDAVECVVPPVNVTADSRPHSTIDVIGVDDWNHRQVGSESGGLALLWPTFVSRLPAYEHASRFEAVVRQLDDLRRQLSEVPLTLVVGMQWLPGEHAEALERLDLLTRLASRVDGARVVGLALAGGGKVRTINAALAACLPFRIAGWIWVDDDVTLSRGCLLLLARRFLQKGCHGAVGARVNWRATGSRLAASASRIKSVVTPRARHPIACCMIVDSAVLGTGIPSRYFCDDAYVYFRLVDPSRADPYEDLEVVDDARCEHPVPRRLIELLRRRRRVMLAHLVCLASAPLAVQIFYLRFSLFYGLWPLAPWDGHIGHSQALLKWAVRGLDLLWFCLEAATLALRGALGTPRRGIDWGPRPPAETSRARRSNDAS